MCVKWCKFVDRERGAKVCVLVRSRYRCSRFFGSWQFGLCPWSKKVVNPSVFLWLWGACVTSSFQSYLLFFHYETHTFRDTDTYSITKNDDDDADDDARDDDAVFVFVFWKKQQKEPFDDDDHYGEEQR